VNTAVAWDSLRERAQFGLCAEEVEKAVEDWTVPSASLI
jgi:hypothetical protein